MDLCMADWLVHHGYAGVVMLHVKQMPWFVSDATAHDVTWIVDAIAAAGAYTQHSTTAPSPVQQPAHHQARSLGASPCGHWRPVGTGTWSRAAGR